SHAFRLPSVRFRKRPDEHMKSSSVPQPPPNHVLRSPVKTKTAICVAGMHRSGTSMVAKLLQSCGLHLGPEEEFDFDSNNGEKHWENIRFVALNEKILHRLGGSWDNPPELASGWQERPEVLSLASPAEKLI